jgi:polysaccharide deacetylase 2 family uncharacterized protein YibQ
MRILAASAGVCALVLLLPSIGCKRSKPSQLSPAQIHQITEELAKAAADAAPKDSVVKSRRGRGKSPGAGSEEIYVGMRGARSNPQIVQQKLEETASRHGLAVAYQALHKGGVRMTLRSHGVVTHRIEIEQLAAANRTSAVPGQARLAILLDDLGNDRGMADRIFALGVPITISVLPFHAHSEEIAKEARQQGCEVMLHLPMQSVGNEAPEQQELRPGLSADQVRTTVEKMLDAVPEAEGVNNHQGSQATADNALMNELMQVLKDEGVFYVDSRTTAATVAFDAAKRAGVRTAFRNVPFLDDVQRAEAVKSQLQLAIQGAKRKGEAIAIGHPHSATLAALREVLPQAKKDGVQLVVVSELVH